MVQAIAANLSAILGVVISPMPVVALLFLLIAGSRAAAAAWSLAWLTGVTIGLSLSVAFGGTSVAEAAEGGAGSGGVNWIAWIMAALFLFLAFRSFRNLPKPGETPATPKWIDGLGSASLGAVFGLAVAMAVINPKNTPLYIQMGANLAGAGLGGALWPAVIITALLCAAPPLIVTAVAFILGDRAKPTLASLKDWLVQHNAVVSGILFLVLGVAQLGKALGG